MSFKRFFLNRLILFFTLTTLITVAVAVTGSAFAGDAGIRYADMLTPLKYAAFCVLPGFMTYSNRELRPKELLLRKVLETLLIEAIMLGIVFDSPAIDTGRPEVVLAIAGSVLLISAAANLFFWLKDSVEARQMNADLARFQQRHKS